MSLGLFVLVGLERGEFAEEAALGDGRGCWCITATELREGWKWRCTSGTKLR